MSVPEELLKEIKNMIVSSLALEDVSAEVAWVFDKFMPDQFGQCGEPWAFTVACQARANVAGTTSSTFVPAGASSR